MSSFVSANVLCPFYKDAPISKQTIVCEGVEPDSSVRLTFGSKVHCSLYMDKFCCKDYKACRVAQMLYKKYEEE